MSNNTEKGFALCEGGILPQVLPNPKTTQEYANLLLAPPIPIKDFIVTPEQAKSVATVPAGFVSVNPVAARLLEGEVKNATLDSMRGSLTTRGF